MTRREVDGIPISVPEHGKAHPPPQGRPPLIEFKMQYQMRTLSWKVG